MKSFIGTTNLMPPVSIAMKWILFLQQTDFIFLAEKLEALLKSLRSLREINHLSLRDLDIE